MVNIRVGNIANRQYAGQSTAMLSDLRRYVYANMLLNTFFVLMALSEMLGITGVHETLPWYLKWIWISVLAAGNLAIHVMMLQRMAKP
jgi:hypothetical protein